MSQGRFTRSRYEANNGDIHPIRIQPETLTATLGGAANAAPTGTITPGAVSAKVSGGNREFGLKARSVTIAWNEGAAPDDYDERTPLRIPVLTPTLFDTLATGSTVSYQGGTGTVIGLNPERRR